MSPHRSHAPSEHAALVAAALTRVVVAWPVSDAADRALIAPILGGFAEELPLHAQTLVAIESLVREAAALAQRHADRLGDAGFLESPSRAAATLAVIARQGIICDYATVEPLLLARADWLAARAARARLGADGERERARAAARYHHAQYYPGGAALLLGRYERGRGAHQPWSSGGPRDLLAAVDRQPSRNAWCADLEMHRWAAERADRRRPAREVSMPDEANGLPGDRGLRTNLEEAGHAWGAPEAAEAFEVIRLSCPTLSELVEARGSADDQALRCAVAELLSLDRDGSFVMRAALAPYTAGLRKVLRYALASESGSADRRRLVLFVRQALGSWPSLKALAAHERRPAGSVQCDMFRARRLLSEVFGEPGLH